MQRISGDIIQWLQTFILVCETGSIRQAAAIRYISPSAASLQIRKLEQKLRLKLFDRISSGMTMTQTGRNFYIASIPTLQTLERLLSNKGEQEVLSGPIRLTSMNKLAQHFVSHILSFKTLHPGVSFNIDIASPPRVLRNVENGSAEIAFCIYEELPGHLEFTRLRSSSAYLYTPPGNPFKLRKKPSWDEICALPFISLTLEGYVNPVLSVLPSIKQPHNIVMAINDFTLALQLVKAGMGVCLSPPLAPLETAEDFTLFNIDHIFPIGSLGIVTRKERYLSLQSDSFKKYIEHVFGGMVETDRSFRDRAKIR